MKFDINKDLLDDESYLTTGVKTLDEEDLCGIPRGTTIAVVADPTSFSEMLLNHLAYTDRKTRYISTTRYAEHIEKDITRLHRESEEPPELFECEDSAKTNEDTISLVNKHLDRMVKNYKQEEKPQNIIINSMTELKRQIESSSGSNSSYKSEVRNLYNKVKEADSLAYLHFLVNDMSELDSFDKEVLNMVDGIFYIKVEENSDSYQQKLTVPKLRGKSNIDEEKTLIKLNQNKLQIDTRQQLG